jgi:hypothetical protein
MCIGDIQRCYIKKNPIDMDEKTYKSIFDRLSHLNIDYGVPIIAIILEH